MFFVGWESGVIHVFILILIVFYWKSGVKTVFSAAFGRSHPAVGNAYAKARPRALRTAPG